MSRVLGLDVSSTSTGVCLPDGTTLLLAAPEGVTAGRWTDMPYFDRCRSMRSRLDALLHEHPAITHAMIEDFGSQHKQSILTLGTAQALMIDVLLDHGVTVLPKVAPSTLKKFATGDGGATKSQMTAAALRAGYDGDGQEDEVDAWWARAAGHHILDAAIVDDTAYRRECVKVIVASATEKRRTKATRARESAERAVAVEARRDHDRRLKGMNAAIRQIQTDIRKAETFLRKKKITTADRTQVEIRLAELEQQLADGRAERDRFAATDTAAAA